MVDRFYFSGPVAPVFGLFLALLAPSPFAFADSPPDGAPGAAAGTTIRSSLIELKSRLQRAPDNVDAHLDLGNLLLSVGQGPAAQVEFMRAMELGAPAEVWKLGLAESLILQGQYREALDRIVPDELPARERPRALSLQGRALLELGDLEKAKVALDAAVELAPDDPDVGLGLISYALKTGRQESLMRAFDDFERKFPGNERGLILRGRYYLDISEYSRAATLFQRLLRQRPDSLPGLLGHAEAMAGLKQFPDAERDLSELESIFRGSAQIAYVRGLLEFEKGDWEESARQFDLYLSSGLKHPRALAGAGLANLRAGRPETAKEHLQSAIQMVPENMTVRLALADAWLRLNQPDKAVATLKPVADAAPGEIAELLGVAYLRAGNPEGAREWTERALESRPQSPRLRLQMAQARIAAGDSDGAINELSAMLGAGELRGQATAALVRLHVARGELDQAMSVSESLASQEPNNPIAPYLTGTVLLAQGGKVRQAGEQFERALALDPGYVAAELALASVLGAEGKSDAAKAHLEHVLSVSPANSTAYLGLAMLAQGRGDDAAVRRNLQSAYDSRPSDPQFAILQVRQLIESGAADKAAQLAGDLALRFPNRNDVTDAQVRALMAAGDIEQAAVVIRSLLDAAPEDPAVSLLAASVQEAKGDIDAARLEYKRAIALDPKDLDSRVALARMEMGLGNASAALAIARQMQTDYPELAGGFEMEGGVRFRERRFEDAIAPLQKALKLDGGSNVTRLLAESLSRVGRDAEAEAVLKPWIDQHPDDLVAKGVLAMALMGLGRDDEAIALYRALSEADPTNPFFLNNLALLLQAQGDPEAEAVAEDAFALAPNKPEIADTYGWILVEAGDWRRGLPILQDAYLRSNSNPEIGYHLAYALKLAGRTQEATDLLRGQIEANPAHADVTTWTVLLRELGG